MVELNSDPESTWGATEGYKAQWNEKYGNSEPAGNAAKAEWVAYAESKDVPAADSMTVAQIKDALANPTGGAASSGPEAAPDKVGIADTGTPTSTGTAKGA